MKNMIIFALLLCSKMLFAQQKYGNVWIIGDVNNTQNNGALLDFNNSVLTIRNIASPASISSSPVVCDADGKLRYYSNACAIWNEKHEMVDGSDQVNMGDFHEENCPYFNYNEEMQILLPYPQSSDRYILFHSILLNEPTLPSHFLCSEFVRLSNGKDSMLYVNRLLNDVEPLSRYVNAVQHGNGRDWWIVFRKGIENTYYWYLLTPSGVELHHTQEIGTSWEVRTSAGQFAFSPDGNRCAIATAKFDIDVFDVDRCEGRFLKFEHINCDGDSTINNAAGVCFSPSSMFMYVTTRVNMFQFDMLASDWQSTKTHITYYDGFAGPFANTLYQLKSAPDNKMYFSATNGSFWLGLINYPDSVGTVCNVVQHAVELPAAFGFFIPNIPYYNSGTSSGCDSLWSPSVVSEDVNVLYAGANVSSDEVTIYIPNWESGHGGKVYLTNIIGQEIMQVPIATDHTKLFLNQLPSATYFCYAVTSNRRYKATKVVVAH